VTAPPGDEHALGFSEDCRRIGDVLEEPHHPDVVERFIRKQKRDRVGLYQAGLDA
jgi:hypothetical protein